MPATTTPSSVSAVVLEAVAGDLVALLGGPVEVDERLLLELGVDRQAEQPALGAVGLDDVDLADRRLGQLALGRQQAHAAGALGDERAAVRQPADRPRRVEAGGDRVDLEVGLLRARLVVAAAAAGEQEDGDAEGQAAHASSVPGHGSGPAGTADAELRPRGGRRRLAAVRPGERARGRLAAAARARGGLRARRRRWCSSPRSTTSSCAIPTTSWRRTTRPSAATARRTRGCAARSRRSAPRARPSSRRRSPPAARRRTRPRAAPGCCPRSRPWRAGGRSRRSRSGRARG